MECTAPADPDVSQQPPGPAKCAADPTSVPLPVSPSWWWPRPHSFMCCPLPYGLTAGAGEGQKQVHRAMKEAGGCNKEVCPPPRCCSVPAPSRPGPCPWPSVSSVSLTNPCLVTGCSSAGVLLHTNVSLLLLRAVLLSSPLALTMA